MTFFKSRLQVFARQSGLQVIDYGLPQPLLTPAAVEALRELEYFERWKLSVENNWYHVKLADHSIFVFQEGDGSSYSYMPCPLDIPRFSDFLSLFNIGDTPSARREYREEYEKVIETAGLRKNVIPIRFDFDRRGYRSGVHPVAHLHFGLDNQVRIASNRMNAVSFFLFVMRQIYPSCWERLLEARGPTQLEPFIRGPRFAIDSEFWRAEDRVELNFNG